MGFLGTFCPVADLTEGGGVSAAHSTAMHQPGTVVRYVDSSGNMSILEYVQADNATVSQHNAVKHSSNSVYGVIKCAAGDINKDATFKGIALATLATSKYGWIAIAGYAVADFTTSVVTNNRLALSATAGELQVPADNATQGNATGLYLVGAQALTSASDTTGSIWISNMHF